MQKKGENATQDTQKKVRKPTTKKTTVKKATKKK